MSYVLSGSADKDGIYSEHTLMEQVNVGTASKHSNKLVSNTSWTLQHSPNYYQNSLTPLKNNNETVSTNNKNRNTEHRKAKMRKVLCKEYKCRYDTASKYTGTYRPRGYRVISQGVLDVMGKTTSKNDYLKPKYVVTKRDPKLRPLEEAAPQQAKRREQVVIRNDQQASCSMRKSQKQERAEKMTYCRPVLDYVNENSIAKTVERNNRLQNIVQKLIEVRQIQKQREAWNNFINELKTRHELNTVHTNENELINDYGNVRFDVLPAPSRPVRYYIEDMYPHGSSMVEQEIKSNIYDYQSTFNNSHLFYGAQPYHYSPNIYARKKTIKQINRTCDFSDCSDAKRQDKDFYRSRQKYKRNTEYVPSDSSVPSKDSDNDYPLTDYEEYRNRERRNNKYRQHTGDVNLFRG